MERSVTSIPNNQYTGEITLPKEGDKRDENGRIFTWTVTKHDSGEIREWIPDKVEIDWSKASIEYPTWYTTSVPTPPGPTGPVGNPGATGPSGSIGGVI